MEKNLIKDINIVNKNLMMDDLFYSLFVATLKKEERIDIPLAAVELNKSTMDFKLLINPKEWFKLSDKEKLGLMKHEALHLVLMHMVTCDNFPNQEMDNYACDLHINQIVGKDNCPKFGIFIENFRIKYPNLDWKEFAGRKHYYDELNKLSDEEKQNLGMDGRSKHRWIIVDGNGKRVHLTESEAAALKAHLENKIERIADEVQKAGNLSSEISDLIKGFVKPKPKINYKQFIRNFATNSDQYLIKFSRIKENARFEGQPKIFMKPLNKIVVYVDESGSVDQKALEGFMNEIFHLKKHNSVSIFPFDTRIMDEVKFKGTEIKRSACGGTEPLCCIEHFEKSNFTTAIIYTDGHFNPIRTTNKSLLWVIDPTGTMETTKNQKIVIKLPNE